LSPPVGYVEWSKKTRIIRIWYHAQQLPMAEAEGHEAWMARLKQKHGRKWRFWELVERSR
jgi:hypothetical protein